MNNERLMVMRNKIENVGLEDCGVDGGLVAEIIDELIDSRYKIESLTAERDEARKELVELRKAPGTGDVDLLAWWPDHEFKSEQYPKVQQLADIARQAIVSREAEKKRADEWQEKYEDVNSERLIVEKERDEVVGLLKKSLNRGLTFRHVADVENYAIHDKRLSPEEAKRILEIVEGK